MSFAYLDTQVAVWLHDARLRKLTRAAQREIERCELRISPVVYFEFDYLFRRRRVGMTPAAIYANLNGTFGITMCQFPFPAIVVEAVAVGWASDPFDRLIVAHARANGNAKLITADELIRENYAQAIW